MDTHILTPDAKHELAENGYTILRGFLTPEKADELREEAIRLIRDFDIEGHPLTTFSTKEEDRHAGDEYFLNSGDKIRYFLEADAVKDGKLVVPKEESVNKIGHGLHEKNKIFRQFTLGNDKLKSLAKELNVYQKPQIVQSMVICKKKDIGGVVTAHDDSTFLYTDPLSAIGFWFALEPCTETNGCLSFVPGSHKVNSVPKRLVRKAEGGTEIINLDPQNPDNNKNWLAPDVKWIPATCEKGDLVVLDGKVIHKSEKNLSTDSRMIYTFHMVDGALKWDERNWLQPTPNAPFTDLYSSNVELSA